MAAAVRVAAVFLLFVTGTAVGGQYTFTHFAGSLEGAGTDDALTATSARFYQPAAVAVDAFGNVYVADQSNHTIRKIAVSGEVTTVAGMAGVPGAVNGRGAAARFNRPSGIAVDSSGNLYVADRLNQAIRKIAPNGQVTTFAGVLGSAGYVNGSATSARFAEPSGVAVGSDGTVYVSEYTNTVIRKISGGAVSLLAGYPQQTGFVNGNGSAARFNRPEGVTVAADNTVYVADTWNFAVRKISPLGDVTTVATPASGYRLYGVSAGGGYVYASTDTVIYKIDGGGTVSGLAGAYASPGDSDGSAGAARFDAIADVAADGGGHLYVADSANHLIRVIDVPAQFVTTLAGVNDGLRGWTNGAALSARFNFPAGAAVDAAGNLYVADQGNCIIRKITPAGEVSTFAGWGCGFADGNGTGASFRAPWGITCDRVSGALYVADTYNNAIRAITASGDVTTLAGGSSGSVDGVGTAAQFLGPEGIVYDGSGHLFVVDNSNSTIRRIDIASKNVTTVAGTAGQTGWTEGTGAAARFNYPTGITIDGSGNLYVTDTRNNVIRKLTPSFASSTLAGWISGGSADGSGYSATFRQPADITYDAVSGTLLVVDQQNYTMRQVTLAGVVSTIGGAAWVAGETEGTGIVSRFTFPVGVAVDSSGTLYVTDRGGVKKGVPAVTDRAAVSGSSGNPGVTRNLFVSNQSASEFHWSIVRKPASSAAALGSPDTATPSLTPDLPDTWTVRLNAISGASSSISTVDVTGLCPIPTPTISASGPLSFCTGGSVTLTASSASNYLWSNGATTQSITVSSSGTFTVTTVDDATGCSATSSPAVVLVMPYPSATISTFDKFCADPITMWGASVPYAGDGATYKWTVTNVTTYGNTNSAWLNFQVNAPGTVTIKVTVTNAAGCSTTSDTVSIPSYALPDVTITTDAATCLDVDTVASVPDAGPGASYSWWGTGVNITTDPNSRQIHYTPTATMWARLSVTVGNANSCWTSTTKDLDVRNAGSWPATVTTSATEMCPGDAGTASVGSWYGTYAWSITNGTFTSATDGSSVTFTAGAAGPIMLSVVLDGGKCYSSSGVATIGSCNPDPVMSLATRSVDGMDNLLWRNPLANGYYLTRILVRSDGQYPAGPNDPSSIILGNAYGQLGEVGTGVNSSVPNDVVYRYAAYVQSASGNWSTAATTVGRPQNTSGPVKWVYNTGATTMTPPGIGSIYAVSNDRVLHSMAPGTTGGLWPPGWKPPVMNQPSQSRPSVVPMSINRIKGATKVVFVSSQDGYVYAFDANSGAELWSTQIGTMVEGAPAVALREYGIALSSSDLVITGTRNSSTGNGIYALETQLGNVNWSYTGETYKIGVISGQVWIDYPTRRIYFASYAFSGAANENHTLWCLAFDDATVTRLWSVPLGDVDGSPILQNNTLYVGNTSGTIYAVDPATGATLASYDTGDGAMKGFIFPISGGLYFSTLSKVWALTDNLGSPRTLSVRWSVPLQAPSIAVGVNNALYVGSGDGKLYKFAQLTAATPTSTDVTLGTGSAAVGAIGFDYPNNLAYVGTAGGAIYAVSIP